MFAAPPDIETRLFTRLPDEFRRPGGKSPWADVQMLGGSVDSFLEGPSFDRDGHLYVVEIAYGRIFRVSPTGQWTLITEYDGEPNGLKVHRDGRIWVADYKNGIMQVDPNSGTVTPVVDRHRLERFKGVNDLFFAANGDCYFTDQGQTGWHDPSGRVFRYRADQTLTPVLGGIPSPNGVVTNHDEKILYVAVTRDNSVWRLPLLADGHATKVGVFIQLSGGSAGPDGMALDQDGNLAVAHAGLGTVWLFDRLGEPIARVRSCAGSMTTNVAYGGVDGRTLFITESETNSILTAEMPVAGRTMFSHL